MDYSKTVLFSDLDGTLFNSRGEISAENLEAIEAYKAGGGKFSISTGRQPDNAMWYLRRDFTNAPSVVLNGAAVYDFASREYLHRVTFEREQVDGVLETVMRELPDVDVQIYTMDGIIYVTPEEQANRPFLGLHRPCSFSDWEAQRGAAIFKCMLFSPEERKEALLELLNPGRDTDFRVVPGTTDVGGVLTYYELLPLRASKGTAIDSLRDHPDLQGRTFVAAGDYWNDYEMLLSADVAVAPANADEGIKKVCRYVTVSNNDHAIAHIIREILPAL